ncbi:MAG: hypothetical protein ACRD3S_20365 [Terracidiphilus sp.]
MTRMPVPRAAMLLLAALCLSALPVAVSVNAQAAHAENLSVEPGSQRPTDAQVRERREKLIANQHADDEALNYYERIERHVERTGGSEPRVLSDRTYRVVPTGGGTMKILVRDQSAAVSNADYLRQLRQWRDVLEMMSTPGNSKGATARSKYERRERERSDFVNATKSAFIPKWLDRETYGGRSCDVFELDPNPAFHPDSMFESALAHVNAKIWVDHDSYQLVRAEAWVTSDISFVAGIAGKVYRGSKVEMEQTEVAPGIWLPTHYEYDFAGRKFLFPFAQHETIDVSHYRRDGPPPEALADVKSELASGNGRAEEDP